MSLNKPINVAVLGTGGREHALAVSISKSPLCKKVYVIPGNDGINEYYECIHWNLKDFKQLTEIIIENQIDFVVVGPDQLLFDGVVDFLTKYEIPAFGPTQNASKLEWSKLFAKKIMQESKLPTSDFVLIPYNYNIDDIAEVMNGYPYVIKYDGLALGKGVHVCFNQTEAVHFIDQLFLKHGTNSIIFAEKFSKGKEVSLFALTNGSEYVLFDPACDYKRLNDNNLGPNTGGMGAFSPVPWLTKVMLDEISKSVFPPILKTMSKYNNSFRGLLYAGLMIDQNEFNVLEFNSRFGDPETQCLLPRLESDLLKYLYWSATSNESLSDLQIQNSWKFSNQFSVNIVASAAGYPDKPYKGDQIYIENLNQKTNLYFAGVMKIDNKLITNGGRVLSVTTCSENFEHTKNIAYTEIKKIHFNNMHYRNDIGSMGTNL